jgi:hypothetical protein
VIPLHAGKMYGRVKVQFHTFLILILDGRNKLLSSSDHSALVKLTSVGVEKRLGGDNNLLFYQESRLNTIYRYLRW